MEVKLRLRLPKEAMDDIVHALTQEFYGAGCPIRESSTDQRLRIAPDGNRPETVNITATLKGNGISYQEMYKLQGVFKPTNQYFSSTDNTLLLTEVDMDKLGLKLRLVP